MVIFEEKQFLQELEYLVNIDSGSGTADGIGQIASFLIGKCSQLGLTVKKYVFDPAYGPCLEVRNHPESEDIDLLLLCHMDTVFPVTSDIFAAIFSRTDSDSGALAVTVISAILKCSL